MLNVMICEDDPIIAMDLRASIEEAGHNVCAVYHTGSDAIQHGLTTGVDLALVDLRLRDGDTGAEVARHLEAANVRVIVLSGRTGVVPGLCGISHTFVTKPVSSDIVSHLLAPHQAS